MNRLPRLFAMVLVVLVGIATSVRAAEGLGAVKQRMAQRLAAVDALKSRGAVGEDNRALLEVRGPASAADAETVAAENADRETVYAALARETGRPVADIRQRRAEQIAAASKPGVWVQSPAGAWYRK